MPKDCSLLALRASAAAKFPDERLVETFPIFRTAPGAAEPMEVTTDEEARSPLGPGFILYTQSPNEESVARC